MATAATSLADFHQMIKLFGADADEMAGGTTTGSIPTVAAAFVSTDELEDDEEEDDNETELHMDEDSPNSSGGEETISHSSTATSSIQTIKDDQPSTKPISSAAAAARLSRLANQRIDSNRFLICSGTNSYNTIRKTKHEVRRFALYLEDTFGENCPIDELKPEQLCTYLKHYFGNVRKADNTEYEPDTLRSFMLSIERYLKSRKYSCNILESPVFASCREVIQEKRDTWAKPNKNVCNSKVEAFTSQHETLLRKMNIVTRDTPDGLLLELLINNSKYFDQRGYESTINRSLLWGDLEIKSDSTTSVEYIEYKRTPQLTTNKDSTTTNEITTTNLRAYAISSHPNECPVVALRLLSYHRPPQCSNADAPFYLVPRTTADQRVWYKTIRAGRHRLDLLLQQAMQKAGINGKFSCMSLRKGKIKGLLIPTISSSVASVTNSDNSSSSSSPRTLMDEKSKLNATSPSSSTTDQQHSSTLNNHKRSTSSTSNSNCSELLDLSSHNNNHNGVVNLAKKIKREATTSSLLLPMPSSVLVRQFFQSKHLSLLSLS
jgi:hypothetical protein